MKYLIIGAMLALAMTFWGCKDTEDVDPSFLQGQFTGTFERTVAGSSQGAATVSLLLEGNSFSGGGGPNRYPVICNGTFTISGSSISFENACFFTADFDWSLILGGTWQASQQGGELILRRSSDTIVDTYRLRRVVQDS